MKTSETLKLGDVVKVVRHTDDTINQKWIGKMGEVVGFINDDNGATPKDPMVRLWNKKLGEDSFWMEEIERA
jgi:hypothetical protein